MRENPDEMMMTTTRMMTKMTRGRKLLAQRGLAARDFALVAVSTTTTTTTTSCLLLIGLEDVLYSFFSENPE